MSTGALARPSEDIPPQGSQNDTQEAHPPRHDMGGLFDLPGHYRPGKMAGMLFGRHGRPVYEMHATVFPGGPFPHGVIAGEATLIDGPHAGDTFPLHGAWVEKRPGIGHYRAVLLRPPADGHGPPEPFIEMRGDYADLNGPVPPPGAFQGRWAPLP